MPRPKKIVKRDEEIKFRVSPLEKKVIHLTAERAGLNVSDFVRKSALNKTVRVRFTEEELEAYRALQNYYDYFRRITNLIKSGNNAETLKAIKETQVLIHEHLIRFVL